MNGSADTNDFANILDFISTQASPIWAGLAALLLGVLLGFLFYKLNQTAIIKAAQAEAADTLQEIKDQLEIKALEEKERIQEIEMELWTKEEKTLLKSEESIEVLEEMAQEKKQKADQVYSVARQKALQFEEQVVEQEKAIQAEEKQLQQKRQKLSELQSQITEKLAARISTSQQEIIQELSTKILAETEKRALEFAEMLEGDVREHSESKAKTLLATALDRFQRPYCPERGISSVYFENPEQRKIIFDDAGENQKALQEITGCDLIIQDDMDLIGVAGFDPVRRELARRILERCLKEKRPLDAATIRRHGENIKRELLGQIKRDGDNLAKELKLEGLHPEIRQMMGSLRYRYSFTQNQHFHCGEVGWLAGLLASELGTVEIKKARRSGMLHDLGKAMDHELEGGHAVIGANFIEKRNEAPDIVHAVRAHHYDEQPSTDMAFLVIAADAISGGRPGARRSTIESYNQKVTELESIARSFDGVVDCYILSGGRECRVIVNSRKIDDIGALKLSKNIATRIESECNYPGQIKVVVVRETLVFESTKV